MIIFNVDQIFNINVRWFYILLTLNTVNMKQYNKIFNLKVAANLEEFVQKDLLKDLNISPEIFWNKFDKAVHELIRLIQN